VPTTRLRWLPSELTIEISKGERLLDALDEHPEIKLPVACRAANCGTCRVRVVDGVEGLVAADPWELDVLRRHDAAPDERLGCQLRFNNDTSCAEVILARRF